MDEKHQAISLSAVTIILGITGSIAAYKSAELARRLKHRGVDVHAIMTGASCEFITPLTIETLTGNRVHRKIFGDNRDFSPVHISLAELPDLVVIAPATADFIGKMAAGLADDLLSSVVMATRAPILLAPAMNTGMLENRIVQENIRRLKERGARFIGPESGDLACGYEGSGRLAAIDAIIREIEAILL